VLTAIVVATMASAAFPPAWRMRVPISEAILFSETTAPPMGCVDCCDVDMVAAMSEGEGREVNAGMPRGCA
jgi:hypothetical protein